MPPSAWTSLPVLAANAPGKAPFSWPNSSLSMMLAGDRLAVERRAAGPWRAGWRRGSRGRRVSLPVPGSPMIRIGRRLRAALAATASAARNSGAAPTSCSSASSGASFSETGRKLARGACGGRHWRRALRAAARERPGGPGNRSRRRASLRPRSATLSPCDRTMTGRSARCSRSAAISCGPCSPSQLPSRAAWTSRPCGPWSRASGASRVGGADHAPAGARGDRRDQPALVGVGVEQQ